MSQGPRREPAQARPRRRARKVLGALREGRWPESQCEGQAGSSWGLQSAVVRFASRGTGQEGCTFTGRQWGQL